MKHFYLYCRKYAGIVQHNHVCLKKPTAGGIKQIHLLACPMFSNRVLSVESAQKQGKKTKSCGFTGSRVPDSVLGWE